MKFVLSALLAFFAVAALAEKMDVKVKDVDSNNSILIGKPGQCAEYEILEGQEDIFNSNPQYDKSKARAEWKSACDEWKKSIRENNKGNLIISPNCGFPMHHPEGEQHVYKSTGTYKVRVQTKERIK
jgi:hypothetical protein